MDEKLQRRNQAMYWAWELNPNRFNVEDKPTVESVIDTAKKIEEFFNAE